MQKPIQFTIVVGLLALIGLAGCQSPATLPAPTQAPTQPVIQAPTETPFQPAKATPIEPVGPVSLANPASVNCATQGGTLKIEQGGSGDQVGICYFEDNRQCEEWALFYGMCPVGGMKVTGYNTPAGRYCVITGGSYAITSASSANNEQGTCTFTDNSQCDAWAYYKCACTRGLTPVEPAAAGIRPLSAEACKAQAQALSQAYTGAKVTQSEEPLNDPVSGLSGTGCVATINGTGVQFPDYGATVQSLDKLMAGQGWTQEPQMAAGGPTGMGMGYRKGNQVCFGGAGWRPASTAVCPKDVPIGECKLKPEEKLYTISLNCAVETTGK